MYILHVRVYLGIYSDIAIFFDFQNRAFCYRSGIFYKLNSETSPSLALVAKFHNKKIMLHQIALKGQCHEKSCSAEALW